MIEETFIKKYFFTESAAIFFKKNFVSLDNLPNSSIESGIRNLLLSINDKKLFFDGSFQEIISSFLISKSFLSLLKNEFVSRKFSIALKNYVVDSLRNDSDANIFRLLKELKISVSKISVSFDDKFFTAISLIDFIKASKSNPDLKLVNMPLDNGMVFLSKNHCILFLGELVKNLLLNNLPPESIISGKLKRLVPSLKKRIESTSNSFDSFSFKTTHNFLIPGSFNLNCFPVCMKEFYNKLIQGKKLVHLENFYLAVFLYAVGLNFDKLLKLYSKAPNFNEKIVRYHLKNLKPSSGKLKYFPPSCKKLKELDLCPGCEERISPLNYYRFCLKEKNKNSNKNNDLIKNNELKKKFKVKQN